MNIPKTLSGVPVNQFPVKEFVDVIVFLRSIGNTIYDVTRPESAGGSSIVWTEYTKFLGLIGTLKDAIVGIGSVPEELSDTITAEEKQQIVDEVKKLAFLDGDELIKDLIEDVIKWLTVTQNFIIKWIVKTENNVTT